MGPRQTTAVSSGTKYPIEMTLTPWPSARLIFPSSCWGGVGTPILMGMLGPYTSASIRPTFAPARLSATERLTATVVFPTPPLPLLIAITCLTFGMRSSLLALLPCCPCSAFTSPMPCTSLRSTRQTHNRHPDSRTNSLRVPLLSAALDLRENHGGVSSTESQTSFARGPVGVHGGFPDCVR